MGRRCATLSREGAFSGQKWGGVRRWRGTSHSTSHELGEGENCRLPNERWGIVERRSRIARTHFKGGAVSFYCYTLVVTPYFWVWGWRALGFGRAAKRRPGGGLWGLPKRVSAREGGSIY